MHGRLGISSRSYIRVGEFRTRFLHLFLFRSPCSCSGFIIGDHGSCLRDYGHRLRRCRRRTSMVFPLMVIKSKNVLDSLFYASYPVKPSPLAPDYRLNLSNSVSCRRYERLSAHLHERYRGGTFRVTDVVDGLNGPRITFKIGAVNLGAGLHIVDMHLYNDYSSLF